MVSMQPGLINDTYELLLPDFRVAFHAERPNWERGRLESCAELMKPGMVVYDIGAECGDFTALYKKWVSPGEGVGYRAPDGTLTYGDGDVIPVEPAHHQWEFIRATWHANGFIAEPAFGYVGLICDEDDDDYWAVWSGRWPLVSEEDTGIPDGGFVHLKHDTRSPRTTIDTLTKTYIPPDAIVIDVEGAEWHALNGARQTLEQHRPLVWVSVHDVSDDPEWPGSLKGWYGKEASDIHNLMVQCGYGYEELPSYGEAERFFLYRPSA